MSESLPRLGKSQPPPPVSAFGDDDSRAFSPTFLPTTPRRSARDAFSGGQEHQQQHSPQFEKPKFFLAPQPPSESKKKRSPFEEQVHTARIKQKERAADKRREELLSKLGGGGGGEGGGLPSYAKPKNASAASPVGASHKKAATMSSKSNSNRRPSPTGAAATTGTTADSPQQPTGGRKLGQRRRSSLASLVGRKSPGSGGSPASPGLVRSQSFAQRRRASAAASHANAETEDLIHEGTTMVKTFDEATGTAKEVRQKIPSRTLLVRKAYQEFLSNPAKVDQVSGYVARLRLPRKRDLALSSILRKHQDQYDAMRARDVFPEEIAIHRADVAYRMDVEETFGHLRHSTRELSLIRIHTAAVDALLHNEAEKIADQQIKSVQSKALPKDTTSTDILALQLDAWRRRNVPEPPRKIIPKDRSERERRK